MLQKLIRGVVGIATALALAFTMLAAAPAQADDSGSTPNATVQVQSTETVVPPVTTGDKAWDKRFLDAPKVKTDPNEISFGGCGFLQNCIYLNNTDQRALLAGYTAGIVFGLCLGGPPICAVATVVAAVATVYIGNRGICSGGRKLRVTWFPYVGNPTCVG